MGRRITQVCILAYGRTQNPSVETPQSLPTRHYRQSTVFHLLQQVILSIRLVNLDYLLFKIYGSLVPIGTKVLTSHGKYIGLACLGFHTQVIVPRIVPSTHIQPWNQITRLVLTKSRGSLSISVYMVDIGFGHTCIVMMTEVMPYTVFFVHTHVAHLYRQKVFHLCLPDTLVPHIFGNAEHRRSSIAVHYLIEPFFRHFREIELQIVVALEISPILGSLLLYQFPAIGSNAIKGRLLEVCIPFIQLYDSHFLLSRMVTYLRGLHHRCITPVFSDCRTDYPFHRTFLCPCRELRTEHKPTVVMIYPSIIQQQVSFLTFNRNLCQIILRIEYKLFPCGQRSRDDIIGNHRVISLSIQQQLVQISFPVRVEISDMLHIGRLFHGGPHRLVGKDSRPVVHNPRLAQQSGRYQFQIKAQLAGKPLGHRLVQINGQYQIILLAFDLNGIAKNKIRIKHRIKACHVFGRIRITQCDTDFIVSLIHHPASHLGQSLPLPLRDFKAHISIGSPAVSIQNKGQSSLVSFRVDVTEHHHIGPAILKISRWIDSEILGVQPHTKHQ